MRGRFTDAQVQGLTDSVDNAVDKALAFAEGAANAAWNKVSDAVNKALFPGEYRHKERNTKYKAAMNALIKEAQTAAATGDYVSAYAIAKAAEGLGSLPPYASWSQISGARTQMTATAKTLADAYGGKAGAQMQTGKGGTYKPGGLPWGWIAAGLTAAALFMTATGKKSSNGGSA